MLLYNGPFSTLISLKNSLGKVNAP